MSHLPSREISDLLRRWFPSDDRAVGRNEGCRERGSRDRSEDENEEGRKALQCHWETPIDTTAIVHECQPIFDPGRDNFTEASPIRAI